MTGMPTYLDRESVRVVGVDAWSRGWVAVGTVDGAVVTVSAHDTIVGVTASHPDAVVIAVDIPIGLPEVGRRRADVEARAMVGERRSSVFATPPRDVLEAGSYTEARELATKRHGRGVSAQSYALGHRILEVDAVVAEDGRLIEVHPEVSFAALAGTALRFAKKTWNGQVLRRRLLEDAGLRIPDTLGGGAGSVPVDDVLDAAAAAWSAHRYASGLAASIPEGAVPGALGVIWY